MEGSARKIFQCHQDTKAQSTTNFIFRSSSHKRALPGFYIKAGSA